LNNATVSGRGRCGQLGGNCLGKGLEYLAPHFRQILGIGAA
jgi:hypothetical protein